MARDHVSTIILEIGAISALLERWPNPRVSRLGAQMLIHIASQTVTSEAVFVKSLFASFPSSPSSLRRTFNWLVKRNWISLKPSSEDQRFKYVELGSKGQQAIRELVMTYKGLRKS